MIPYAVRHDHIKADTVCAPHVAHTVDDAVKFDHEYRGRGIPWAYMRYGGGHWAWSASAASIVDAPLYPPGVHAADPDPDEERLCRRAQR